MKYLKSDFKLNYTIHHYDIATIKEHENGFFEYRDDYNNMMLYQKNFGYRFYIDNRLLNQRTSFLQMDEEELFQQSTIYDVYAFIGAENEIYKHENKLIKVR
ncbi:TPA: hypothetical protein SMH10_001396 [Klebsiella oxytoca]|uniref:hypothetical protein n=1 Tax=Klebsiella oxytoca TaxID=571 RepID=UPI001956F29F|nr:hypothetical protein [Klebsiella oxytoca]QRS58037.1 hypothetical protein I6K62_14050 [Klebsiella oxytoca]HEJ7613980.1 hypothetical protein [Klebsiella oxytoca]HEJ8736990.1 hypothetical protein [Klebsiella oxytoca]